MSTEINQEGAVGEIPVRYEVEGNVIELSKVNRLTRLMLKSQTKKLRKKFKDLKGVVDDKGQMATIVIRLPKLGVASIECVIEYPEAFTDKIEGSEKSTRIA